MGKRKDCFGTLTMEFKLMIWYNKSKVNSGLIGVMSQKGMTQ